MTTTTENVPKENETTLGLYVSPEEAYEMWKDNPDKVTILDVRTPEEYVIVGHPLMARNIPFVFPKFKRPADSAAQAARKPGAPPVGFTMQPNPNFIAEVKKVLSPTDTILVLCGSGGRAAMAVNALAKAGFTKVYNIVNGFLGEMVNDRESPNFSQNLDNGWDDLGLPWGRALDPDLMWDNSKQ
jgi:rhodanese-related sulfurtransferase